MRLAKDKTEANVNESLTLARVPSDVFEYRLGNRSALDWVIDQYRGKTDTRSGITSHSDDPEYIVAKVFRVGAETVEIVDSLSADYTASENVSTA